MRVTIEIDAEVITHMIGGTCKAGEFKPCGLSEHVMQRVYEAVREEVVPIEDVRAFLSGDGGPRR